MLILYYTHTPSKVTWANYIRLLKKCNHVNVLGNDY